MSSSCKELLYSNYNYDLKSQDHAEITGWMRGCKSPHFALTLTYMLSFAS